MQRVSSRNEFHKHPFHASMSSLDSDEPKKASRMNRLELTRNCWLSQSTSKLVSSTPRSKMMAEAKRWDSKSSSLSDSLLKAPKSPMRRGSNDEPLIIPSFLERESSSRTYTTFSDSFSSLGSIDERRAQMMEAGRWESQSSQLSAQKPERKGSLDTTEVDIQESRSTKLRGAKRWQSVSSGLSVPKPHRHYSRDDLKSATIESTDMHPAKRHSAKRWQSISTEISVPKRQRHSSREDLKEVVGSSDTRSAKMRGVKRWQSVSTAISVQKPQRQVSQENLIAVSSEPTPARSLKRESSQCVTRASVESRARMMQVARQWQSASLPKEKLVKPRRQRSFDSNDGDIKALIPPRAVSERPKRREEKTSPTRSVSEEPREAKQKKTASPAGAVKEPIARKKVSEPIIYLTHLKESRRNDSAHRETTSSVSDASSTDEIGLKRNEVSRFCRMLQSKQMWDSTSSGLSVSKPQRQKSMDKNEFASHLLSPTPSHYRRMKSRKSHSSRSMSRHASVVETTPPPPPVQISVPMESPKRTLSKVASLRSFISKKNRSMKDSLQASKTTLKNDSAYQPPGTTLVSAMKAKFSSLLNRRRERLGKMREMMSEINIRDIESITMGDNQSEGPSSERVRPTNGRRLPPALGMSVLPDSDSDSSIQSYISDDSGDTFCKITNV